MREAAALVAVGEAFRVVARGHADAMVAGATGTRLLSLRTIHILQQEELANGEGSPESASRPFDVQRKGMVLGEGAGAIVLESLEVAQARGAKIYAEVRGAGTSTVADSKLVPQRTRALANAIRAALRDAQMTPDQIGHIQAHGLSTRSCDIDEARAIVEVFGDRAAKIPVTAVKSYCGNLGAGSGLVELIAGVFALNAGQLFPILNLKQLDPECPINGVRTNDVPAGESCLKLSVTPQGQASCVIVSRFRG
jgi:3-oxoacyl-[acyl-carrier-protein] synthase II